MMEKHGNFTYGKFDQFNQGIPYVALVDCFASLVNSLLSYPNDKLQTLSAILKVILSCKCNTLNDQKQNLGTNGQVISQISLYL